MNRVSQIVTGLLRNPIRRNMLFSGLNGGLNIIAFFISYRLLIQQEGIEAVGLWSLTIGAVAFLRIADVSGGNSLSRFLALPENEKIENASQAQLVDTVIIFSITLYLIMGLLFAFPIYLFLLQALEPQYHSILPSLLFVALILLVTMTTVNALAGAVDGVHRADQRSIIMSSSLLLYVGASIMLIGPYGIMGLAIAQLIQQVSDIIGLRMIMIRKIEGLRFFPTHWSPHILRAIIPYTMKLQINAIANLGFEPMLRFIINHFAGLTILSIYDLAVKLTLQTRSLLIAASKPLIPKFASNMALNIAQIRKANNFFIIFAMLQVIGLTLMAPIIAWSLTIDDYAFFQWNIFFISLGYGVNNICVPIYLYCQAKAFLFWNILGQLLIAIIAIIIALILGVTGHGYYSYLAISFALGSASIIALLGNIRRLEIRLKQIFSLPLILTSIILILFMSSIASDLASWIQRILQTILQGTSLWEI